MTESDLFGPLVVESTPALVADRVRAGILNGTFQPHEQLSEVALARQLAVSRGPIREAMQRLIQEGLLRSVRNRGVFVVALGPEDAQDVYLARGAVERLAADIVARRGTAQDFAGLQERVDAIERAAASSASWLELAARDLDFHQALVATARSPRLDRMFRTLIAETQLCLSRLEPFYPGRDEVVREHQEILDAVVRRDTAEADRLVVEHMDASAGRLSLDGRSTPTL
jgi:DNA-binding GntR family transcriptional regulator